MSGQSIATRAPDKKLLKVMITVTAITAIIGIDSSSLALFKINADVFATYHEMDNL